MGDELNDASDEIDEWRRQRFASEFSAALRTSGLPLSRLRARLDAAGTPVSVATLSYWQSGRSLPSRRNSLRAIENLEQILGVPSGDLAQLLTRTDAAPQLLGKLRHIPFVTRGLATLNLDYETDTTVLELRAHTSVSSSGRYRRTLLQRRFRVDAGTVARLPLLMTGGRPAPTISSVRGGRLGQEFRDNQRGIGVAEIILPRVHTAGEVFELDIIIDWGQDADVEPWFEWGIDRPGSLVEVTITFADPPAEAVGFGVRGTGRDDEELLFHQRLPVVGGRATLRVEEPVRGVYGVRWADRV